MSYLSELKGKNIVVLGAGMTGLSCARFLHHHDVAFTMNDSRDNNELALSVSSQFPQVNFVHGKWHQPLISQADVLIVSPGIDLSTPEITQAIAPSCQVIGDVELYCLVTNTPILAVTGSNGKSTVVSLLAHVGSTVGLKVQLGGNIGAPVLDQLITEETTALDMLVLELSSFQLETLSSMKAVAASVLNVSDDHLDRHKTLANYGKIKRSIYQQSQVAVINRNDPATACDLIDKKIISFGRDVPQTGQFGLREQAGKTQLAYGDAVLIALDELPLAGIHNALNYLAVLALGYSAGWPLAGMVESLKSFQGLPHRCQRVATDDGIMWVNDSKATNVGSTLAAIEGLAPSLSSKNKLLLIAGGDGKGADFTPLKQAINQHVAQVFTLGKDGQAIANLTGDGIYFSSLEQAVSAAGKTARAGDIVLLSPACASLDMFQNFAQRGQAFIKAVNASKTPAKEVR